MKDFEIPEDLSPEGKEAAKVILSFLEREGRLHSGGCRVFYSPQEWKDRGEEYGLESELIICHDGGDHAAVFNLDYECYKLYDAMFDELQSAGFFPEGCTCWYSAIYKVNDAFEKDDRK